MSGRRILIVGLNYAPEPVGIGPYTAGLAEELAARGSTVEAIVGKPYYPQWRPDPAYAGKLWRRSNEAGVALTRCAHYVPRDPGGLKRVVHLFSFACAALVPTLSAALRRGERRPELVIAIAPALLSVFTAWLAARFVGAKLWVHLQDFEVEAALATGLLGQRGLAARLALKLEAWLLRRADRISTISPQMCARLIAKGVAPAKVLELRNWADTRFKPDPKGAAELRREWGLGERKVLLYSGNIARKQGIEVLIDAAWLLQQRHDLVFVICGEGPNRAVLATMAEGLENVWLFDLQPVDRMGALLELATLHLLPQIAGAADLVLPSKLTNMLASGKPVVATAVMGTGLAQEVEGCGLVVPPEDPSALADAIAELVDDPLRCAKLGAVSRRRAAQRWEKGAIIDRFEQALDFLQPG